LIAANGALAQLAVERPMPCSFAISDVSPGLLYIGADVKRETIACSRLG
jgi:hypothetical protein